VTIAHLFGLLVAWLLMRGETPKPILVDPKAAPVVASKGR